MGGAFPRNGDAMFKGILFLLLVGAAVVDASIAAPRLKVKPGEVFAPLSLKVGVVPTDDVYLRFTIRGVVPVKAAPVLLNRP